LRVFADLLQVRTHRFPRVFGATLFDGFQDSAMMKLASIRPPLDVENT
jgi:hypothetical protein